MPCVSSSKPICTDSCHARTAGGSRAQEDYTQSSLKAACHSAGAVDLARWRRKKRTPVARGWGNATGAATSAVCRVDPRYLIRLPARRHRVTDARFNSVPSSIRHQTIMIGAGPNFGGNESTGPISNLRGHLQQQNRHNEQNRYCRRDPNQGLRAIHSRIVPLRSKWSNTADAFRTASDGGRCPFCPPLP